MARDENAFDDRKKSQEAKYKMDEERRFKVRARRNKLLGQWVAERLGLEGDAAQELVRDVAMTGLEARTDAELLSRIQARLAEAGSETDPSRLEAQLARLQEEAQRQIAGEFPSALSGDHGQVGDPPHWRK